MAKLKNSLISLQENKMPNHRSIVGCTSGYKPTQEWPSTKFVASFHYSFSKPELLQKWISLLRNGLLTASSVMYVKQFHEDAVSRGLQRVDPIPKKESTSLWKATAQWTKHWIMRKTTLDKKFGARSLLDFKLEDCMPSNAEIEESILHPHFKSVKPKIQ